MRITFFIITLLITASLIKLLTSTEIAYSIFYAIFLLFLISPFFFKPKKVIYKQFKYLGIWGLIFLLGITLIAYKDILLNNRITSVIMPGHVEYNEQELIFYIANDNHFYIHANVNGRFTKFLLDTGASDIILSKQDAIKLGFDLNNIIYNKRYHTANGIIKAASITLNKIIIGDIEFYNIPATISNSDMQISLAGMSFLKLFNSYNFDNNRVVLKK